MGSPGWSLLVTIVVNPWFESHGFLFQTSQVGRMPRGRSRSRSRDGALQRAHFLKQKGHRIARNKRTLLGAKGILPDWFLELNLVWILLWSILKFLNFWASKGDRPRISVGFCTKWVWYPHPFLCHAGLQLQVLTGRERKARLTRN